MYIHTVKPSETLYHIARKYGTSAIKIAENNGLGDPDKISVGQKLLILTPTRTYTVRGGDTLDGISHRFGVSRRTILQNNPYLAGRDRTYPEEIIALKYDAPKYGSAAVNGYMYRGCTEDRLIAVMPYINYLSIAAYKAEDGRIIRLFDDTGATRLAREHGRIPVMRVYEPRTLSEIQEDSGYCERLCNMAVARGYSGITLGAYKAMNCDGWCDLLFELKKRMIEFGLFLFTEVDGNARLTTLDTVSDSHILCYEKCHLDTIPSFADGEEKVYTDFASIGDPCRTFADVSPFAYSNSEPITQREATEIAYRAKKEIEYDKEKMICKFDYRKFSSHGSESVTVKFDSPENIKAKLDLFGKLGYMGISFDVLRATAMQIMMIATSFSVGMDYLSSAAEM